MAIRDFPIKFTSTILGSNMRALRTEISKGFILNLKDAILNNTIKSIQPPNILNPSATSKYFILFIC